ncbi:hypothetical protein [Hoeflea sp.]|uniref:hypothetical protein n=1 Tax=Hoeflea sp. TaxID=1940281 RepID=UPI003B012C04
MRGEIKMGWTAVAATAFCLVLLVAILLLRDDPGEKPYLKILGGSFIFNYRVADVYMGFTAVPEKPIPVGTMLVVTFENPSGGSPYVVTRQIGLPDRSISVRSPSMRGVKAKVPYRVMLELQQAGTRTPFWNHVFSYDDCPAGLFCPAILNAGKSSKTQPFFSVS